MKTKKVYLLLRIIVIIGWLTFFGYFLMITKQLGTDYNNNPADFVFFDDEKQRIEYADQVKPSMYSSAWIQEASLVTDCKPMIYFNKFYFEKIEPVIKALVVLIVMTIFISIPWKDWLETKQKIEKPGEKFKGDDDDEPDGPTK
ncbi:MAG: hypothetical protein IIB81_00390 [Nanoarchaeota archaeon]|nr:hypothetical protein [Nanoarchaeota archaeon]